MLESAGLLNAHMQAHHIPKPSKSCEDCGTTFWTQIQLVNHIEKVHMKEQKNKEKPYNCQDCSFQGENGLDLKKHIRRTKHTPCDHVEQCYTCKKDFKSYWHLMNHRKLEHPSNKVCRYFLKQECDFDSKDCWYSHEDVASIVERNQCSEFKCNVCEKKFENNSTLMKHKKMEHPDRVSKCKRFEQGKCNTNEQSCWFIHPSAKIQNDGMEMEKETTESVFREAQEKSPPDQMGNILNMISKLSFQVEQLEKMSKQRM